MIQKCVVDRDWVQGFVEGREPGGFSWATSCLAVQMLFGEVFARKSAQ